MMAFRAKILHVIVFGLIGATVIIYSSYFTGPVLLYHIDPERSSKHYDKDTFVKVS